MTTARASRAGTTVTCSTRGRSGLAEGALSRTRFSTSRSTTRISTWANDAPMQRRTPPPNGIQAYDSGCSSMKRSGRNSSRLGEEVGPHVHRGDGGKHQRAGGQTWPAISVSRVSLRATSTITGRIRSVSFTTASRYSSSSSESSSRSITRGVRIRRSNAQESPVAVVSCPAVSRVRSSSRSSESVIALPSSWRAESSSESTSSPGSEARRSAISA